MSLSWEVRSLLFLRRERKGKIYNGYFLMFFIMAPISSTLATTAGMSPSSQTASAGTMAQKPQASLVQPAPIGSIPPGVPVGVQPGVPGMPPEQKKSKWWLWAILALGLIILVGLVAYYIF